VENKYNLKDFQIRKNVESAVYRDCPYFPCHSMDNENFSCLYCYCIFYDEKNPEGGCLSKEGNGKWFIFEKNGLVHRVWDCSSCTYPHKKENAYFIFKSQYKDENQGS